MERKPNFVLVITDQQSGNPYWPEGWADANLPAMRWLKQRGITFERAYANSCTCSPARASLLTGLYPAQHSVTEVLEFDNIAPILDDAPGTGGFSQRLAMNIKERRQRGLSAEIQSVAKVLKTAGYKVVLKGKWHLSKPARWVEDPAHGLDQRYWTATDVEQLAERWGFEDWGMPDAGDNMAIENMGAGTTRNDQRFIDGRGQAARYGDVPYEELAKESALHFLKHHDPAQPFCLILSLVNPHDVLAYPGTGGAMVDGVPLYLAGGYRDEQFMDLPINRPPTWDEDLATKPRAQSQFRVLANVGNGPITATDEEAQLGYCRFYAYLCRHVDFQIAEVLKFLEGTPFADDTYVIRTSDHGDMAMAHGLQRQKMFNVYEEALNVPLIIAHPKLAERAAVSHALVSAVDLLPTLATLAGVPNRERWTFKGKDLAPILLDPKAEVQDTIHFTYEDLYFFVSASSHIRAIVEKRWKYAVYFDIYTNQPFEYEMYDLGVPRAEREVVNLGNPATPVTPEIAAERERLHQKLIQVMTELGTTPEGVDWPKHWGE